VRRQATQFAAAATPNEVGRAVVPGRSHGELGRSTALSPPLGSDETRPVELRSDEIGRRS